MHGNVAWMVVIGVRTNEVIVRIGNLPILYYHHTYAAHAASTAVGSFKIYGCEVLQCSLLIWSVCLIELVLAC